MNRDYLPIKLCNLIPRDIDYLVRMIVSYALEECKSQKTWSQPHEPHPHPTPRQKNEYSWDQYRYDLFHT